MAACVGPSIWCSEDEQAVRVCLVSAGISALVLSVHCRPGPRQNRLSRVAGPVHSDRDQRLWTCVERLVVVVPDRPRLSVADAVQRQCSRRTKHQRRRRLRFNQSHLSTTPTQAVDDETKSQCYFCDNFSKRGPTLTIFSLVHCGRGRSKRYHLTLHLLLGIYHLVKCERSTVPCTAVVPHKNNSKSLFTVNIYHDCYFFLFARPFPKRLPSGRACTSSRACRWSMDVVNDALSNAASNVQQVMTRNVPVTSDDVNKTKSIDHKYLQVCNLLST